MTDWHYIISRIYVWITRWNRCRGFGIQSPNDYAFVRDVVNEHRPYYGYRSLNVRYPSLDAINRMKFQLYLRVANFSQPGNMIDRVGDLACCNDYILAGCKHCRVERWLNAKDGVSAAVNADILRCRIDDDFWLAHVEAMNPGSLIIIEPTRGYAIGRRDWQHLVDVIPFGVCYNLYYCGIIIIDKKRYKQNYIINF